MSTKAELQERVDDLKRVLDDIKEVLGVSEEAETLQGIKEALEEVGFELPEDDEIADAIREYDFIEEEEVGGEEE